MHIEPKITIPFVLALLVSAACTEAKPRKSEVVEGAKPSQPILTSTAPLAAPKPDEDEKTEPPLPKIVEASAVEPQVDEMLVAELPSFEPELEGFDGLSIQRLVTASAVERREPVAVSSVFGHHDERVYAFVDVSNESGEDKALLVHFIGPDGQVSGGIELRIPADSPRWRTWAYTRNATKPGLWRVEIRSEDGTLIGALPFEVESGC